MEKYVYEKIAKGFVRVTAEKLANRVTRQIAAYWGDVIPMYLVSEFPRSGGSWLSGMIADYLRCPRPGASLMPFATRAALHNHWRYHPRFRRVIYLYRDGRDVMTSLYFYRIRGAKQGGHSAKQIQQRLREALGPNFDPDDTETNLPKVLAYEFEHPLGAGRYNWATHVLNWYDPASRPHVLYLSYEQLLADPVDSLTRAVSHVGNVEPLERLIHRAVDHWNMSNITGRKTGEESRTEFYRKGISGDWKNHFTRATAEVFDRYAGEALIKLGYEQDRSWIEACPEKLPAAEEQPPAAASTEAQPTSSDASVSPSPSSSG